MNKQGTQQDGSERENWVCEVTYLGVLGRQVVMVLRGFEDPLLARVHGISLVERRLGAGALDWGGLTDRLAAAFVEGSCVATVVTCPAEVSGAG